MDYFTDRPFGPPMYFGRLTEDDIKFLLLVSKQTKEANTSMATKLAGNIELQLALSLENNEQQSQFSNIMYPHIQQAIFSFDGHKEFAKSKTANVLKFHLGNGPWINFQKKYEFNPIHAHSGILSAVVYISVPEEIEQERLSKQNTNKPASGNIDFVYGDDHTFISSMKSMSPKTGDVVIFPSYLKHLVYPFTADVERISMSFNVFDIVIDDETTE